MKSWVKGIIFITVITSILICYIVSNGALIRIYPNKIAQPYIDIRVWKGYEINSTCPYETTTTDEGYDLVIHMIKSNS